MAIILGGLYSSCCSCGVSPPLFYSCCCGCCFWSVFFISVSVPEWHVSCGAFQFLSGFVRVLLCVFPVGFFIVGDVIISLGCLLLVCRSCCGFPSMDVAPSAVVVDCSCRRYLLVYQFLVGIFPSPSSVLLALLAFRIVVSPWICPPSVDLLLLSAAGTHLFVLGFCFLLLLLFWFVLLFPLQAAFAYHCSRCCLYGRLISVGILLRLRS